MPESKRNRKFNLLKPFIPPPNAWDRIYDWLLGRARVIMVIAEVVVVVIFVTKVVVDIQAKDLNDEIKTRDFELQQYAGDIEPGLRRLQIKADNYVKIWNKSSKYSDILTEIDSYLPNQAANIEISFDAENVVITADEELTALSIIEAKMKSSPSFNSVFVAKLNAGNESRGIYVLNAKINTLAKRTQLKY